ATLIVPSLELAFEQLDLIAACFPIMEHVVDPLHFVFWHPTGPIGRLRRRRNGRRLNDRLNIARRANGSAKGRPATGRSCLYSLSRLLRCRVDGSGTLRHRACRARGSLRLSESGRESNKHAATAKQQPFHRDLLAASNFRDGGKRTAACYPRRI